MLGVVGDCGGGGREGVNTFGLAFEDDAGDVACDVLAEREDAAVADRTIGAKEG